VEDHGDDRLRAAELALVRADELCDRRLVLDEATHQHSRVVGIGHLLRRLGDDRGDLILGQLHGASVSSDDGVRSLDSAMRQC
jgi:hypothetical protein